MAEQLLLDRNALRSIRLSVADGVASVYRGSGGGWEILFLVLPLVLLTFVIAGGLVGVACTFWIAATQRSALALLVAIVLGIALLPGIYTWIAVQGLIFPFKASIGGGRYWLANGVLRLSLRVTPQDVCVVICPTYSRGSWGYGAKLKVAGKALAFPFIPKGIVGTKHNALLEAHKIRDWLQKNSPISEVTLAKWGDTRDIRPGVDYIR